MLRSESLIASGPTILSPVPLASENRGVYSMNGSRMGGSAATLLGTPPSEGRKPRRFSHFPPRLWMVARGCTIVGGGEREVKHEEGNGREKA